MAYTLSPRPGGFPPFLHPSDSGILLPVTPLSAATFCDSVCFTCKVRFILKNVLNALGLVVAVLFCACHSTKVKPVPPSMRLLMTVTEEMEWIEGRWRSDGNFLERPKGGPVMVQIEVTGLGGKSVLGRTLDELSPQVNDSGEVSFQLSGEGGFLNFTGHKSGGKDAEGKFKFKPDPEFISELSKFIGIAPTHFDIFLFSIHKVSLNYLRALAEENYKVTVLEVIRLRNASITPEYISELQKSGQTFAVPEVLQMRNA